MDYLFNTILSKVSDEITIVSAMITMLTALVLGVFIALTYQKTQEEAVYQRSLAITLVMLTMILSVIILFIGSNIARAFSLAGTLSIIRFRSAPGDAKDIGFIFFDIAAGLACGVGMYGYGTLFVVVLCLIIIIVEKTKLFSPRSIYQTLKITIPEDLNYQGVFDEILSQYTSKYELSQIRTTDLGSLYQLTFQICMDKGANEQEMINALRTRNGNLTILLSQAPEVKKTVM